MTNYIKRLAEKLWNPCLHWHALRHLNNSLMLNDGVDVKNRMDRLGHVTDRVNIIYSHSGDAAQKQAPEVIWKCLEAAAAQAQKAQELAA